MKTRNHDVSHHSRFFVLPLLLVHASAAGLGKNNPPKGSNLLVESIPSLYLNAITSLNEVNYEDNIYTGEKEPPYGTGSWYWDIPWKVITNSGRTISIGTFQELATSDNNGKAVISKGGATQSSNAGDQSSDW